MSNEKEKIESAKEIYKINLASLPWPEIATGFTIIGGAGSALSAINSFRQVGELKDINRKMSTMIELQHKTLSAIIQLGIKFEADLENAFIKHVEVELKSNLNHFVDLCSALNENLEFPSSGYNYNERLAELTQRTEILTGMLTEYGAGAYQTMFVSCCMVDCMFKLLNVDMNHRSSFFEQNLGVADDYNSKFRNYLNGLIKTKNDAVTGFNNHQRWLHFEQPWMPRVGNTCVAAYIEGNIESYKPPYWKPYNCNGDPYSFTGTGIPIPYNIDIYKDNDNKMKGYQSTYFSVKGKIPYLEEVVKNVGNFKSTVNQLMHLYES